MVTRAQILRCRLFKVNAIGAVLVVTLGATMVSAQAGIQPVPRADENSRLAHTQLLDKARAKAATKSLVSIDDVGVATAFLAHDAARLITGETLYIDGGYTAG